MAKRWSATGARNADQPVRRGYDGLQQARDCRA
jgi:hypothetical protein